MYNKQKERLSNDNLSIFMVPDRGLNLPRGGIVRCVWLLTNLP